MWYTPKVFGSGNGRLDTAGGAASPESGDRRGHAPARAAVLYSHLRRREYTTRLSSRDGGTHMRLEEVQEDRQIVYKTISDTGIGLPNPPAGTYVPVVIVGDRDFVSGRVPFQDGKIAYAGMVYDSSADVARDTSRLCMMNVPAHLQKKMGFERT